MKKTILSLLTFASSIAVVAQNGGQSSENAALKIEYVSSTATGQSIVKVTNKQPCGTDIMVFSGSRVRTKFIASQASDTFVLTPNSSCRAQAQPINWCGGMSYGLVETNICTTVPVKFEYFWARSTANNEIEVEFKLSEVVGSVSVFNVQISTDGRNYRTVRVILPSEAKLNSIYNAKIKL